MAISIYYHLNRRRVLLRLFSFSRNRQVKTVLFDAYYGTVPRLRWYMEGKDSGTYIKLLAHNEKIVKEWGPLPADFLGSWHHVALTVRMARQYSRTSSDPSVIITQAFLFIDGKHIVAGNSFSLLVLHTDLIFESGLSDIFVGGTSPQSNEPVFRNLKGSVDNLRVWWPPCPHDEDPTRCNPYGFLYPQLLDGARQPASGIHDNEVTLAHVAKPVETYMFTVAPDTAEGLLAQFTFDDEVVDGVLETSGKKNPLSWKGPHKCSDGLVCPGCNPECRFSRCKMFDTECVEAGASDPVAQKEYATKGTCQCLNVDDCPRKEKDCKCPLVGGKDLLNRVCSSCRVGVCKVRETDPEPRVVPGPPAGWRPGGAGGGVSGGGGMGGGGWGGAIETLAAVAHTS
jgi:hypothetical protein